MGNVAQMTRPPTGVATVTASASPFANGPARAFYCGTTGNATFTFLDGTSATFNNIVAGVWHPMNITHMTAFTGADAIIGF